MLPENLIFGAANSVPSSREQEISVIYEWSGFCFFTVTAQSFFFCR